MIKKTAVPAIAVMIFAILTACSPEKKTDEQKSATPTPSQKKLTVTVPAGWAPNAGNKSVMMKGAATYTIKIESMPAEAKTPDAFIDFMKKAYQKSFGNVVIGGVSSLKVSGNDARKLEFSGDASGLRMNYIVLYVFDGNQAHTLTCGAMASEFAKLKGEYEQIIASAKLE